MADTFNSGLITPEAVRLDLPLAGVGSRMAAALIDLAIRLVASGLVGLGVSLSADAGPNWVAVSILIFAAFALTLIYPIAFESMTNGRTPGKMMFGLRVVSDDGSPVRFRQAATRGAIGLFEVLGTIGILGSICMFITNRAQRLGDIAAGTIVVRERSAQATPRATRFVPPQGLEFFAANLDVSRLTAPEYQAVREYLLRSKDLSLPVRANLSGDLAHRVARMIGVTPSTSMTAEAFLQCVAAAYQRRSPG